MDHADRAALADGHVHSVNYELGFHQIGYALADGPMRENIKHDCQIQNPVHVGTEVIPTTHSLSGSSAKKSTSRRSEQTKPQLLTIYRPLTKAAYSRKETANFFMLLAAQDVSGGCHHRSARLELGLGIGTLSYQVSSCPRNRDKSRLCFRPRYRQKR